MTQVESSSSSFWLQLWNAVDRVDSTTTTTTSQKPHLMMNALRNCAVEAIRQREQEQEEHYSLFPIAWAAHSFLSAAPGTESILLLTIHQRSTSVSKRHKLGCLFLLEACCGDGAHSQRSESPFFRLLVVDALELLLSHHQYMEEWERQCVYELVESCMPDILGDEVWSRVQQAVKNGTAGTAELKQSIDEELQAFLRKDDDVHNHYVSPLLLFPPPQSAEIVELLQSFADEESKEEDEESPLEKQQSIHYPSSDLLQPLKSLQIPFVRPLPPPLMPVCGYEDDLDDDTGMGNTEALEQLHAELIWLTPSNLRLMLLPADDAHNAGNEMRYQQVLELMQHKAFLKPLAPNEQRMIMELLNEDDGVQSHNKHSKNTTTGQASERLIKESGLNPQNLHRLVENNPMVAHECLLRILRPSPDGGAAAAAAATEDDKNEYLSSLVSMDMSLHTMEVVNRLATLTPNLLHPEYIHLFIGSCIASCENIPDQHAQNRLVRLVCVFVQSLLRNQIVQVEDVYVVMESFCIEFSRIREAAALFKMLRSSGG